jgi:hypothetical protein
MYFEFDFGESGREEFEFKAWNPWRDDIVLRAR